jgi:hypothetical protein
MCDNGAHNDAFFRRLQRQDRAPLQPAGSFNSADSVIGSRFHTTDTALECLPTRDAKPDNGASWHAK